MKKDNIFWISYSDLMTSLFFIMLVLFVISIGVLKGTVDATKNELNKIEELQTAVQQLPEEYFDYQPEHKRFKLKEQILFDDRSYYIKPKYHNYLVQVGNSIIDLVSGLENEEKFKKYDIKYLIVIEGMASRDNYPKNFELSYERALALYRFWTKNNISFDDSIFEIQISGSGTEGIREYSGSDEKKNQQFLIHIIPKMGKIQASS